MCGINNAYVLVKTSGGTALKVLKSIREMDGVKEANGVFGNYDIVARIESEDLVGLVVGKIRALDGVVDTNTLVVAI